jgi:tetratricopeptide (TPR) repeat protein
MAGEALAADVATLTRGGLAAHQRGDLAVAEQSYRDALALDAGAAVPMHFLGMVLYQRGHYDDALPLVERSLAQRPQEAEFHNNAGLVYLAIDRVDDAIAAHRGAIERRGDHVAAWNNLGLALMQRNDVAAAIDAYRRALALQPSFDEARWNLALALLARGEHAEGWQSYDARLALPALSGRAHALAGPRYAGESLRDRTLLVTAEQGMGDTLQFIRFARDFAERGARVIARVPRVLATLCATAPGVAASVASDAAAPPFDWQLPLGSAATALGVTGPGEFARDAPYLFADAAQVARWRDVVRARGARLNIGLSWAGNPRHRNDRRRSVPLAALAPLLAIEGVAWYSLQHVDGEAEVADVPAARALVELDARHDFDGKAALMRALDLVISVDTSHAHLAGALGVPVWVLLPLAADWRWGVEGTTTPWYASARLYRQSIAGDWREPVAAVADALRARLAP